jgi:serine/threonine-protein kinase
MSVKAATVYEPGYVIAGKYELEALLGQGGMGAVWRARNVALDSLVALKVMRAAGDLEALRGRLVQEARAAAKLAHPAIVKVFDVGQTESGDPFIVMELLHGSSLGTILAAEARISSLQIARIMLPIADALSLAHSKGIIHRDLKPDNVFVVNDGGAIQPKLVDFGIVKVQQGDSESHLTQAGAVLGSPDYMSPEQARGQDDIDFSTDVWSFSVVLYEAITGQTPFKGANYNALLRQIVEETPTSPDALAACDAALSAIVMRGLSKQREHRFRSMGEMGRVLATWLIEQGVHEDICGSTLEPRWLRGTDPHARPVGRASLASISEGWPAEHGSGVRPNALGGVNTLPAPPRSVAPVVEPSVAPPLLAPSEPPTQPSRRPLFIGGGIALAAFALGWWAVASLVGRNEAPAAATSQVAAPTALPAPAPLTPAPGPEPTAVAAEPSAAPPPAQLPAAPSAHKAAQGGARKVSSPAGRAAGAGGHAPKSSAPKAGGKPAGDLLSPYQ